MSKGRLWYRGVTHHLKQLCMKQKQTNKIVTLLYSIMNYIQQEIDKFLRGEINQQQLKESLHYLIDDIVIPDAVYVKNSIDNNTLLV